MSLESHTTAELLHKCAADALRDFDLYEARLGYLYVSASTPEEEPVIPARHIFNFIDVPTSPRETDLPHRAFCAAHLELLEVFLVLRQRLLASPEVDRAFGIQPQRQLKVGRRGDTKLLKDETLWHRRQVKWQAYLEFATVRFLRWREAVNREGSPLIKVNPLDRLPRSRPGVPPPRLLHIPPLDVLMVWHAFMLNPRFMRSLCHKEILYRLPMPWEKIHEAIRNRDWTFTLKDADARCFRDETGLHADLLDEFSTWADTVGTPLTPFVGFSVPRKPIVGHEKALVQKYRDHFAWADKDLAAKLKDAVVRQSEFVDKMNNHLWIRSPALGGTLSRAIHRYGDFLHLLRLCPGRTIVPTLDIDLVWHTHQCSSPKQYAEAMEDMVGRFVNHDDTIAKDSLREGFDFSQSLWHVHLGTEYRVCGCWDCEALLSAVDDLQAKEEAGVATNMEDVTNLSLEVQKVVTYYRAVEVSVRAQRRLPVMRDEASVARF